MRTCLDVWRGEKPPSVKEVGSREGVEVLEGGEGGSLEAGRPASQDRHLTVALRETSVPRHQEELMMEVMVMVEVMGGGEAGRRWTVRR